MNRLGNSLAGLLLAVVLFFGINVLAGTALRAKRIDLTESKIYTLSEGTKRILADLDQRVTLHFFFSKKVADDAAPEINTWAERVRELLQEFAQASKGRLELREYDPEPFSEAEDRAGSFGLRGQALGKPGEYLYIGLAGTNEVDGVETIPVLAPQREAFLEYDVAKLVSTLVRDRAPVVGLLTPLQVRGGFDPRSGQRTPPWFAFDQVEDLFELRPVDVSASEIPEEIEILLVVHPQDLAESAQYAIDQFVLRGGKLALFVDPHCEVQMPPRDPQNPMAGFQAEVSSDLPRLFDAWGVELVDEKIVGDKDLGIDVPIASGVRKKFVHYLDLGEEQFVAADPISAELEKVLLISAGLLRKNPAVASDVTFAPLMHTTALASEIDRYRIAFGPDPDALLADYKELGEEVALAARLTGPAKTAFPDGKPAEGETEESAEATSRPHLSESAGPINVVVFADVDMLTDRTWVQISNLLGTRIAQPFAQNCDLLINTLDNLSGSNDLISLRSRGSYDRPFTALTKIRLEADAEFKAEEDALEARLREVENELQRLQSEREDGSSLVLTSEQKDEIKKFRDEQAETRRKLRDVRHKQNRDIERKGTFLSLVNTLLVPLGISVVALGMWFARRKSHS